MQVVVNLYPFRQTVTAATQPSFETAIENIDIGGSLHKLQSQPVKLLLLHSCTHARFCRQPASWPELLRSWLWACGDCGSAMHLPPALPPVDVSVDVLKGCKMQL